MTPFETLRKALLAGFGAREKVSELIEGLVEKGELSKSQGAKLVREWAEKAEKGSSDMGKSFSDIVAKTLEKMNIPTKEDVEKLNKKVHALSGRIKKLEGEGAAKEE